jgi:antitoxin component YwqK of YwqJK toxin-antitoxin module
MNREENYKSNKLNGLSRIYYDSGQIQEEATYVNDEKSGLVRIGRILGWKNLV